MRQLLTYLFILWSFAGFAQNLVPNGSFEVFTNCPVSFSDQYATDWFGTSTDYFNPCNNSINGMVGVPQNLKGNQNPFHGNAYGGFGYLVGSEFLQVKLIQPLDSGKKYCVRFYISLSDSSSLAPDSIGALLSDTNINLLTPYQIIPQILEPGFVTDKINWTLIQGTFTANGTEELLSIGCFSHIINPGQSLSVGGGCNYNPITNPSCTPTYYYVDSVSVTLCSESPSPSPTESSITIPNVFTPNGDGLNDAFLIESTGIESIHCEIFNRWGIKVATLNQLNEGWDGRTTSGQEAITGVYFYVVNYKNEKGEQINKKGFFHLLR